MKYFFILLGICFTVNAFAQKEGCQTLHTGNFRITSPESGTTNIKREGNLQIEENVDMKVKIVFDITWTTDCSYELRPKEVIRGDRSILNQGLVLKAQITGVTDNSYMAEVSSNFSDLVLKVKVVIVD